MHFKTFSDSVHVRWAMKEQYFLIVLAFVFSPSGTLTMTALLGVTSIKALRSSGSSALCPNVQKVQLHKKQPLVFQLVFQLWLNSLLSLCVFLLRADKYQECVLGSGKSYRGTTSVSKSGSHCLPWDSPAVKRKLNNAWRPDALELGLGSHSFCR